MAAARNLLVIMTDQLGGHVLDRKAHDHFTTPALSALAGRSLHYDRAYTSFPLCTPARSSFATGRYPHELGVNGNDNSGGRHVGREPDSWGHHFTRAGFETLWGGKWHACHPSADHADGFARVRDFGDHGLTDWAVEQLTTRGAEERPFVMAVSFDDPHTICEYARSQPMPYGDVDPVPAPDRPPLPVNHAVAPYAPQCLRHEREEAAPVYATGDWGPDDWRAYRHTYASLVQRVDGHVGRILDALAASPHADDTAVVVLADHGDGDAAHQWSQKTALYEESIRVPLLIMVPGATADRIDVPVNVGIDLLPTACALVGVEPPVDLPGQDLSTGRPTADPVVVQTRFPRDRFPTVGRSIIDGSWKYTVYSWGRHREQLVDLAVDPGEQRNLAVESRHHETLVRLRARLAEWCVAHDDHQIIGRLVTPTGRIPTERPY
ncbi:sulfatase family protein [Microlunatus sp. Y2014]|uniref:sulfatase family protein n=1 Tax=Microlunatus sp. Y2014 TaxID=3418488 RepID=UPI003DA73899